MMDALSAKLHDLRHLPSNLYCHFSQHRAWTVCGFDDGVALLFSSEEITLPVDQYHNFFRIPNRDDVAVGVQTVSGLDDGVALLFSSE